MAKKTKTISLDAYKDALTDTLVGALHAAADLGLGFMERRAAIDAAVYAVQCERLLTKQGKCSKCEVEHNPTRCKKCGHTKQDHENGDDRRQFRNECFDGAPEGNQCSCSGWEG